MNDIDKLINLYLSSKYADKFEMILNKLSNKTSSENYMYIINKIDNEPNSTELDLSLYINEISNPNYLDLEDFIYSKILLFKDSNAIKDLQNALIKIAKPNC